MPHTSKWGTKQSMLEMVGKVLGAFCEANQDVSFHNSCIHQIVLLQYDPTSLDPNLFQTIFLFISGFQLLLHAFWSLLLSWTHPYLYILFIICLLAFPVVRFMPRSIVLKNDTPIIVFLEAVRSFQMQSKSCEKLCDTI